MTESPSHSFVGKELGNYVVRGVIGQGGMGAVFAGEHRFLGDKVAIKVLHGTFSGDEGVAQRFFQEAKSARDIGHPGIIKVIDFGRTGDGTLYLVMELLEGQSLARAIREARFQVGQAARLGAQIADAVAAAHARGIVHRDLKPDNIFLVDGGVKILDFGIAKVMTAAGATKTGSLLGTPYYMAPEQARGTKQVGPAVDVYALGAILFEMLTGRPPFVAEDLMAVISAHLFDPVPPLDVEVPELDRLVRHCLEKDPAARPAAMTEVRDRLRAIADSLPAETTRLPAKEPVAFAATAAAPTGGSRTTMSGAAGESVPRKTTRGRRPRGLVAALALAVAAVGGVALTLHDRSGVPPVSVSVSVQRQRGEEGKMGAASTPPPSAATVTAPPPAAPAPAPAEGHMVSLRLHLQPSDARVELDGVLTGENPLRMPCSDVAHKLVVSAPGHLSETRELRVTVDGELDFRLKPDHRAKLHSAPAPHPAAAPAPAATAQPAAPAPPAGGKKGPKGPWQDL